MADFGVHSGFFLVELDGVTALEASEVSGIQLTHEPTEIPTGNREKPIYSRGKSKVEPVTVKHAKSLNNAGREIFQWFNDFHRGVAVERRNLRVVQLSEDGKTPLETTDLIDCLPTKFKDEGNKADGKDAAYFSFEVQPSDIDYVS